HYFREFLLICQATYGGNLTSLWQIWFVIFLKKPTRVTVLCCFRWQTLVGGFLLHVSWKLGWVEISCSSRSEVLTWLPASALFVGIIYAGSRALSRLVRNTPVEMNNQILCLCFLSHSVLFLLIAAGCLPFFDTQFDPDGYFWALIHLICVGKKPVNVLLCSSGDLFSALDFPFLYFYRFHSSCCASGLLGFFLMLHTVKLKSITSSWQYAAWSFLAKVRERPSRMGNRFGCFLFFLLPPKDKKMNII
uniref:Transmembrane protein 241 n=1 Tax=Chelonoidis abingdonii TaxID=106734 RepID=A0A8C0GAD7_CHEAB